MNALTRWDPFRELEEVQGRFSSILARPTRRLVQNEKEALTTPDWSPPADILEDEKEYLIRADIPGVEQEAVSVRMENRALTIAGERKLVTEDSQWQLHRVERAHGVFARSFILPENADPDKVEATFRNGVLEVHVSKIEAARPKVIEVKIS